MQKYLASFWNLQLQQAQTPANFKYYLSDLVEMDSSLNLVSNDIIIVSFQFEFLFINNIFLNLIPEEFYYFKNHLKWKFNIITKKTPKIWNIHRDHNCLVLFKRVLLVFLIRVTLKTKLNLTNVVSIMHHFLNLWCFDK